MVKRRVGLWMIGACGSVGSTAALGLSAAARGLTTPTGMVTALPQFARLGLDEPAAFVVGGHDIRRASFVQTARDLHERAGLFSDEQLRKCAADLEAWSANVRPGTVLHTDPTIAAIERILSEINERLQEFKSWFHNAWHEATTGSEPESGSHDV